MKKCIRCGKEIDDDALFCSSCGLSQQPIIKSQSKFPISWVLIVLVLLVVAIVLVPVLFPSINEQSPGEIILMGLSLFIFGLLAWFVSLKGYVKFVGRGECCLFFPVIGLIVFLYGLVALVFR